MGYLENELLDKSPFKPLVWFRYIDDIFFLRPHGEDRLNIFFEHCNSFDSHIKFEQTFSLTNIPLLDVQVIINDGKIETDLYTKPTNTHQYLNWTSCHPRHTKTTIPYSLALGLRCICSTNYSESGICRCLNCGSTIVFCKSCAVLKHSKYNIFFQCRNFKGKQPVYNIFRSVLCKQN